MSTVIVMRRPPFKQLLSGLTAWNPASGVPLSYRAAAAGLALIAMLILGMLIALQSAQSVFDDQEGLRRGIAREQRIDSILSSANDVESGVRGFFISNDPQYLEPYERGSQLLQQQLDQLDNTLGGEPATPEALERFRHDIAAFLEQSEIFVLMRQQMPADAGLDSLTPLLQRQKERIDALRDGAAVLLKSQSLANAALDVASAKVRRSTRISILTPSFLSVLLAAFLCYLVIRDLRQRQALELRSRLLLEQERQARAAAEAANQAKDEFVSNVSHELRTPLQAILGWAQFLTRLARGSETLPATQIGKQLHTIERNAHSLARMIDDLLDVSSAISGKLTLVTRRVDVADILQASIEVARPAAAGKGVQLALELQDAPLWMVGDGDRLRQVAINLINNAVKFTPTGGSINVSARRVDARLEVKVRDSGVGIPPELLPRIFERYVQGSGARQFGGLGLGLAIVKHLVELHGGQVGVHSEGSGRGAEFTLGFPIHAVEPRVTEPAPPVINALPEAEAGLDPAVRNSGPRLSGLRVLVVDDDADVLLVMRSLLAEEGARVVSAASAAEAMERLRFQRMDLVLSDIAMPVTDGYALARSIRALVDRDSATPAAVPLIALTAFSRVEDARRALDSGFDMHLAKPVDVEQLIEVLSTRAVPSAHAPIELT